MGAFAQFLITPFSRAGVALVLLTIPLVIVLSGSESVKVDGHYGILSLLPAAVAILLAFLTRQVLFALLIGIFMGGLVVGEINILGRFMIPAIGSEQYALILLVYLWCLGGLLGLWTRTGGALAFAEWARSLLVTGRRSAKVFAWMVGILFHQGGTISTVLAGTTVRPVTDDEKVSHEELSYIIDSTASPVGGGAVLERARLPNLTTKLGFTPGGSCHGRQV